MHNNSKPSTRGDDLPPCAPQSPSSVRQTSPSGNPAAGPPEGPPLLAPPPKSLLPPRPPLRSRRGRVNQPCSHPVCGRGRAVSPVIRTARPGECWALNDSTALNRPRPVQQPTSATRRFHVRDERPERPTAVEGPVTERSEAVHPGGPVGTCLVGDQLHLLGFRKSGHRICHIRTILP